MLCLKAQDRFGDIRHYAVDIGRRTQESVININAVSKTSSPIATRYSIFCRA